MSLTGTALYLLPSSPFVVTTAEEFAAVDEPGADPLLTSSEDECVFPVGGLWIDYGDGGAGKTTLMIDQCLHFAAGISWHGYLTPARPLRILFVEAEGPRPEFRRKLRRRLQSWDGPELGERFKVLEEPWGTITLRDDSHRRALADQIDQWEIDLVVIGPLRTIGMKGGGTLDEIEEFHDLLLAVREHAKRPVGFRIVHHENRAGQISGAWEGVPDVLAHVQPQGQGSLRVFWQKVRWSSTLHLTTTHLVWAEGDSFALSEQDAITTETMEDGILEAVRMVPGASWTKIRGLYREDGTKVLRGNLSKAEGVRDRLLADGRLVNRPTQKGQFKLYLADDPAARSEPGTGLERLSFSLPEAGSSRTRSTVPPIGGTGSGTGPSTGKIGTDGTATTRTLPILGDDGFAAFVTAAFRSELITADELEKRLAADQFIRSANGRARR